MSHHRVKYEPDGSVTEWGSPDGRNWRMTGQTYPRRDPKPAKRIKASPDEWVQLRKQKLGPCRCCGENMLSVYPAYPWNSSGLESTLHHVVPKSLGGDDVAENLVSLCGDGTRGCHGLVELRDPWACSLLGQRLTTTEREYVIGKKGSAFLARYYGVKEVAA